MKNFLSSIFSEENEFLQLTKDAKRLTHISLSSFILPVIFYLIAGMLSQLVFAPIILGDSANTSTWHSAVFTLVVMFGTGTLFLFLWVKIFEGRKISSLGFKKGNAIKDYLSGFALGLLMNSVIIGIMAIFGAIEFAEESANITGFDAIGIIFLFLLGFIIQGGSEEILSRGWMLQVIGAKYKPWLGVLISTIVFAVLHLGNSGINIPSVLNLLLVGLLLALFVFNTGKLWFACAWHSAWNWNMGNIYGLSVSGTGDKVTLIDLNTKGNELISGGGFGPEGSLITTVVLAIGVVYYISKVHKNSSNTKMYNQFKND